jgi:hypothetical protein
MSKIPPVVFVDTSFGQQENVFPTEVELASMMSLPLFEKIKFFFELFKTCIKVRFASW